MEIDPRIREIIQAFLINQDEMEKTSSSEDKSEVSIIINKIEMLQKSLYQVTFTILISSEITNYPDNLPQEHKYLQVLSLDENLDIAFSKEQILLSSPSNFDL